MEKNGRTSRQGGATARACGAFARKWSPALLGLLLLALPFGARGKEPLYPRHSRENFRHDMARTVRADHPAIVPVADAIRRISRNPLEQLVIVNDVTHLLVDYDDDERVYGAAEFHATFEEMLARRRQAGWLYLRDDCDGRAVFAAHLLAALGIPWRLEASFWKEHAWIVARVNGRDYDLLDLRSNAPETDRLSYKLLGRFFVRPSQRPPAFAWRRAWAERTHEDLGIGLRVGLLSLDSTPGHLRQRYSTDWTLKSPGGSTSPFDDRVLTVAIAGFPYGEARNVAAIAAVPPKPPGSSLTTLGVTTSSPSSAPADTPAAR